MDTDRVFRWAVLAAVVWSLTLWTCHGADVVATKVARQLEDRLDPHCFRTSDLDPPPSRFRYREPE